MNNLYMTTEEFAAIIVDTLDEQGYFKKGRKNHPSDMAASFVSTAETVAAAMEWAIRKVHDINLSQKVAMMKTGDLSKNSSGSQSTSPSQGEKLVPKDALEYSEWKRNGYL